MPHGWPPACWRAPILTMPVALHHMIHRFRHCPGTGGAHVYADACGVRGRQLAGRIIPGSPVLPDPVGCGLGTEVVKA